MDDLSPWVSSLLTALGIFGTLLGIWLARRGKREDNKRLEQQQSFSQLESLADARKEEIDRKDLEIARISTERDNARAEVDRVREQARADVDRVRQSWEDRWDRQMKRCRTITATLVDALAELKKAAGPASGDAAVDAAMSQLRQHNEDDHDEMEEARG